MGIKHIFILLLGILWAHKLQAQSGDTLIKSTTIEIIQSYKPEVERAPKPEFTPHLPPADTTTEYLNYTVPDQKIDYTYSALPLRPLALNVNTNEMPFANYIKLGGGNRSTLLLDAGIGSLKGRNYETNINIHHLSQKATNVADQKLSLTGVDATGTLHKNSRAFGVQLGVHNNTYHYYGYDHDIYNYNINAVKQSFTDISAAIDMEDESTEPKSLQYHPTIRFNSFSDKFSAAETTIGIALPFTYTIDKNTKAYATADATITKFNNSITSQNNNVFKLSGGVLFAHNGLMGRLGLAPTWGQAGKFYFLPDIDLDLRLPESQFVFNIGWVGNVVQNSYKQMATLNPYMYNSYTVMQTRASEVFCGIKSNLGENISFNGMVSWWSYQNLPMFINDTATDKKQFVVIYGGNVNALGLQAGINYQVAELFAVRLSGQWMNYYKKTFAQVWHTPAVRFTGAIDAHPIKKLTINAYITFTDELYALDNMDRAIKLNSILDIGAGAEYAIIDRLNVFLTANNLLNKKYQRWYGYDAFGTNILGGIRFKF